MHCTEASVANLVVVGIVTVILAVIVGYYIDSMRVPASISRFEQGIIMSGLSPPTQWVPRPEVEAVITKELSGKREADDDTRGLYVLISGVHGTGKSSLCARICNGTKKGCIYSVVHRSQDFALALATAIDYNFDENINVQNLFYKALSVQDKTSNSTTPLGRVLAHIRSVARKYKQKHSSTPVLVIDNINYLSEGELRLLQEVAKGCAEEGILRFIFVSSDSWATTYLQDSAHGRMKTVRVGDISIDAAIKHLKNHEIPEEDAMALVALTGGRLEHLEQVRNFYQSDTDTEAIKEAMIVHVMVSFEQLVLFLSMDMSSQAKKAWRMLEHIYDKEVVDHELFYGWLGMDVANDLLTQNICAVAIRPSLVTFQSPLVRIM